MFAHSPAGVSHETSAPGVAAGSPLQEYRATLVVTCVLSKGKTASTEMLDAASFAFAASAFWPTRSADMMPEHTALAVGILELATAPPRNFPLPATLPIAESAVPFNPV